MIVIVGLGNPGTKYEKTRHNVGFMVLDKFAANTKAEFKMSEKFNAEVAETTLTFPGERKHVRTLLVKPQTFMNNSGDAVSKIVNFYKVRIEDQQLIVHDDLDIDLGTLRIRLSGSSAGQKGVGSIIDKLGTDKFARFRMGIKPEGGQTKPAEEFVLEKFRPEEMEVIEGEIDEAISELFEAADKGLAPRSI
jgi:PTH1 family peptidyl-tRNA hydrolase